MVGAAVLVVIVNAQRLHYSPDFLLKTSRFRHLVNSPEIFIAVLLHSAVEFRFWVVFQRYTALPNNNLITIQQIMFVVRGCRKDVLQKRHGVGSDGTVGGGAGSKCRLEVGAFQDVAEFV